MTAGLDVASRHAPLALWPGAGEGLARGALLRAHPLLSGGIVDGEAFGRSLHHVSMELERRIPVAGLSQVGLAHVPSSASFLHGLALAALNPLKHSIATHPQTSCDLREAEPTTRGIGSQ